MQSEHSLGSYTVLILANQLACTSYSVVLPAGIPSQRRHSVNGFEFHNLSKWQLQVTLYYRSNCWQQKPCIRLSSTKVDLEKWNTKLGSLDEWAVNLHDGRAYYHSEVKLLQ